LTWSTCDALLYTGGEDALVKAWNVLDLLALGRDEAMLKPLVVWNHHTLSITALCPAQGNLARVASASVDRTAKILDVGSGSCLASIALPAAVNTVCLDPSQRLLFAGTADGIIHKVARELRYDVAQ
jgi:pre-rRNA-processing protein IPI3